MRIEQLEARLRILERDPLIGRLNAKVASVQAAQQASSAAANTSAPSNPTVGGGPKPGPDTSLVNNLSQDVEALSAKLAVDQTNLQTLTTGLTPVFSNPVPFSSPIAMRGNNIDLAGGELKSTAMDSEFVRFDVHWDDFVVAPQSMGSIPSVDGPDLVKVGDDGAGSIGVYTLAFNKTKRESVTFDVQLPHGWRQGTAIQPHVHWCPTDTGTGNVVWELEYTTWANVNDPISTTTTVLTATDAADGVAYKHQAVNLGEMDMTGKRVSTITICRFARVGADAGDTYDNDALVLSVDFHIQKDSIGSNRTFSKGPAVSSGTTTTTPGVGGGKLPDFSL